MKLKVWWIAVAAALTPVVATDALAQGPGRGVTKAAPEEKTGPKVGAKAPGFSLKDQDGEDRSLDDLLKGGKVALVFYRSADW